MGAEGDYAQTPKASTFHVANAPKRDAEGVERLPRHRRRLHSTLLRRQRDAEGVERLHLRISVDVVVTSRQQGVDELRHTDGV